MNNQVDNEKTEIDNIDNMEEELVIEETDSEETGVLRISNEVVSIIACKVASEIEGVASMGGTIAGSLSQYLGRKNLSRGVKVEVENDIATIDLNIIVEYGARIPEVAWNIQEKVKLEIETMTGLKVKEINIHVQGIQFEKEKEELEEIQVIEENNNEENIQQ